jgi:hypothetical protein
MGVPYRSVLDEDERNISGAFFRTLAVDRDSYVGGLLLIDARGEPLEFTYNRVAVKHRFLWRDRDMNLAVVRELLTSLLDTCPKSPSAVFCLAREVDAQLFLEDVDVQKPLARVAGASETLGLSAEEEHERIEAANSVQLFWVRGRPSDATPAHRLVERLSSRGLLLEPFERVLAGLREAYELPTTDET